MIGIASGYALKIQNVQELYDANKKIVDKIYYGPIYGVIEMNLIDVREDEGGGYVYADNVHKRDNGKTPDFLETTGNFVFPYDTMQNRYIVDDCFPTGFNGLKTNDPDSEIDVHYWYVTGFNYYYNAHITGFTYKDAMKFNNDNRDGLTVLAGLKPNQPVTIQSWKMRSGHPEDNNQYSCDLEERNYKPAGTEGNVDMDNQDVSGKYKLCIGASSSEKYDGNGFAAVLPMNGNFNKENYVNQKLPSELTDGDAKISFRLTDNVNNTTTDYFKKHLSEKCLATVVLKGRAYEEYTDSTHNTPIISKVGSSDFFIREGNDYKQVAAKTKLSAGTDYYIKNSIAGEYTKIYPDKIFKKDSTTQDGYAPVSITDVEAGTSNYYCEVERIYTYTIYLTIEYVQGPNINGNITVDNCALPGEMIRLKKNNVTIAADQAFSANGYYWRIGKRKKNADGKWEFEDHTEWDTTNKATGYDTYKQGDAKTAEGLFKNCKYDKTNDYLDIPAYYFMNGYGVQLGITMNGLDKIFTVDMDNDNEFLIHNYHRMNPHQKGVNLHLSEAIQRSQEDKTFAEPRIYISDASDLKAFINFVDTIGTGTGSKAERYGKNAQFILQNDITVTSDFDGSKAVFAGTLHGNGHVIKGLAQGKSFLKENRGNIYNLGMESGNIAAEDCTNGGAYHCCFEYNKGIQPIVYHMDGTSDTHYTADDFRYGKVGYDLNEYYLRARYSNNMEKAQDKEALKYVYDYYANGDYQYAHRTDAITGNNTGITYLRKGSDSDQPNYGSNETRHDQNHASDAARKASAVSYVPLFNGNQEDGSQPMNDFIFWGQSLQKLPALYPSQIASHQNSYMRNRIYRTAGYYGDTKLDAFHYNASNNANSLMSTYVHQTTTTAIDFTCLNDKKAAMGFNQAADINQHGIFYPPVNDNAEVFSDLSIQQGVSQNLLVYTAANGNDIDKKQRLTTSQTMHSATRRTRVRLPSTDIIFSRIMPVMAIPPLSSTS